MSRYISVTDTAKLLRAALKASFPDTKFSVRSSSYSGGASIDVSWTDGPPELMVRKVTGKFSGATFDGMIDLKSYHDSDLNGETVSFGADFVFTTREFSERARAALARKVKDDMGYDVTYGVNGFTGDPVTYEMPYRLNEFPTRLYVLKSGAMAWLNDEALSVLRYGPREETTT